MSCDVATGNAGAMTDEMMQVRVKRISYEAENVNSYELVAPAGGNLASFAAGSHIDLHLSNGMIRSYSLTNDQSETEPLCHRGQQGRGKPRRLQIHP